MGYNAAAQVGLYMFNQSSGDVEVCDEAGEDVTVLVGTVDLDLSVVVTEGSEGGNEPGDGVGILVSSTVLPWGG